MATYPPTTYQGRTVTPTADYVRTAIRTAADHLPVAAGGLYYRTQTQDGSKTYEGTPLYTPAEVRAIEDARRAVVRAQQALADAMASLAVIDLHFG